ncbi:hypothetical protein BG006_009501 [Podila minutissima]|uniref:Uncharacterized protein n=1 Tax=Podila minutissima TaxID=64525 RepID=A0A9P5SH16_9FUNG|nr:hypothetical protein BG006_009501 [Podila minutissima]
MLTKKQGVTAVLAVVLSSINSTWADVVFVKYPANTRINPGDPIVVKWTQVVPATVSSEPFTLLLRALSGQSYVIQRGVAQNLLTLNVNIPANATGGLHSFRADYPGTGGSSSNQITITGRIVNITTTTTAAATLPPNTASTISTTPTPHTSEDNKESSGGLSGAALGGIIGGVVVFFLLIALIFFFRHRRRVRERSDHSKPDNKENYGHLSSRNGSVAMTTRSMNGPGPVDPPPQGTNISGPLSVAPSYEKQRPSRDDHNGPHSPQHMQHQGRNPFEEDRPPMGGATSLSPRQQHQPYQPPQITPPPPRPFQQGPPPYNNQQSGYTLPPHQQGRGQSPFHDSRDSFESEAESAYDPRVNQANLHGPAPMMRGPPLNGIGLSHSPSGRSNMSDPRPQGSMSPALHHQQQQQQQQQRQAGSMSPMQSHRPMTPTNHQQYAQNPENRSQSPFAHAGTPRQREIEMQPLDIQQHQFEQQQRVFQRQQQQQQQQQQQLPQQEQQNQHAAPFAPVARTALSPFNPTQYDDKTEIDEDGVPVYNGYRDTIFGAYVQTLEDDEDDSGDDRAKVPTPIVPAGAMALGNQVQQQQVKTEDDSQEMGAAGVQRKKSVKFTGVPASGPIVVPQTQEGQQSKQKPLDAADDLEEEEEDEDGYYDDEDDIKMRLMETEVPNPTVSNTSANRPFINTAPGVGSPAMSSNSAQVLSPVRSLASPTSPYQQHQPVSKSSPVLDTTSPFGNGFYEDVLAAVDNHGVTSPVSPRQQQQLSLSPRQQHQPLSPRQQHQQQMPVLPQPVPRSPEPNQHYIQQQHLPLPQSQHLTKEVYGAPSPRIAPATARHQQQDHYNRNQPPSPRAPMAKAMSPRSAARQPHSQGRDDEESAFYESQLI